MSRNIWLAVITLLAVVATGCTPSKTSLSLGTETPNQSSPTPTVSPLQEADIFDQTPVTVPADKAITLIATGDVLTARTVNQKNTQKNDFTWPFHQTADILKSADLTFINLETPLTPECPVITNRMVFCGDEKSVEGLLFAGIDVVNFANNHAGNQGQEGVDNTTSLLRRNNFLVTGVDGPTYAEVKGTKIAFLGYNAVDNQPGVAKAEPGLIKREVATARANADIVVVAFHWGHEYTYRPSALQSDLAHLAIDEGADLIIGHHPHWFQRVEMYKDKLIMYSHGNFVFDQMWSQETREGIVGKYVFYDNQLVDVEFMPVLIEDYGQPRWLEGTEKDRLLEILEKESKDTSTQN